MSYAALCVCIVFLLLLFARDRKLRPMPSWGGWVAFLWVMAIGTKSIAYWLGADVQSEPSADQFVEGSPVDRAIFLSLIAIGTALLWRRKIQWGKVIGCNRSLFFLFLYFAISIAWSDFPFVSFKRWVKDVGNVIMVLLMISETCPIEAVKAVFSRYIYFAVPVSILLIYFFPQLGLTVHPQSGDILYIGVTTDKNELGVVLTISGLFIVWELLVGLSSERSQKLDMLLRGLLLVMVLWLIVIAKSATALICLTLGVALLLLLRISVFRQQIKYLGTYTFFGAFALTALLFLTDITENIVKLVEKDMTLTGRTDIWAGLLAEPINPLLGTGYSSFWLKPSMIGSFHNIIQAHNGYLETYLNGGLIGVFLLLCLIGATGYKLRNEIIEGSSFATLLFATFVISLFYNLTETMFNRLDLIWFMFLVAALKYPEPEKALYPAAEPGSPVSGLWDGGRFERLPR